MASSSTQPLAENNASASEPDSVTQDMNIEKPLSEQQLRELYDGEEIDRFLSLFSAYVTEVQLQNNAPNISQPPQDTQDTAPPDNLPALVPGPYLSEQIALRFLHPILPQSSPSTPLFTLGRLRLTTQRLYLALSPYGPFFRTLVKLAKWESRRSSSFYCLVFWTLWWRNLLLPALFLRILGALARRRVFPYPTLAELRRHRKEIDRAIEFGEELSTRFSASSNFGVKELWRIFRVFNKPKKTKVKKLARNKTSAQSAREPSADEQHSEHEVSTVLDSEDTAQEKQENDGKRAVLQAFSEIADLHERIKNIFIWRRPASSRIYGFVIVLLFVLTLFLPAQSLAKLAAFIGGFFFWHVTPVIAALPPGDHLPPAFSDVPTDAEYAMELISQRVAAGLPIQPVRVPKNARRDTQGSDDAATQSGDVQPQNTNRDKEIDWKKWGERAAAGASWVGDSKRRFTSKQACSDLLQAFPAQHTSAPGIITLTNTKLYFYPLMSPTPKVEIPLLKLRAVKKKSTLFTALTVAWTDEQGNPKEERFLWVGESELMSPVKQEIFMTDVSNCVASLKKVVTEMQFTAAMGEQLQMAQPAARPSAVTLTKDPGAAYLLDFDALVADWDEYLNIGDATKPEDLESEDEFDPKSKSQKSKRKNKASQPAEEPRADQYTLQEHHDHLLSNSLDLSFNGNNIDPSSSQNGGGFVLDEDIFLAGPDGLDIGGLGDDLAKELGEGWGVFPDNNANDMQLDNPFNNDADMPPDFELGTDAAFGSSGPIEELPGNELDPSITPRKRKANHLYLAGPDQDKENIPPSTLRRANNDNAPRAFSPATSFSRLLLSQDEEPQVPLADVTTNNQNQKNAGAKKPKKTRLLLDARTELTDEELKTARAQYLKGQAVLRRDLNQKRAEKEGGKFVEDLLWGVPRGVQAGPLIEFWQENFKVQVEARTGNVVLHPADEPPKKRRKIRDPSHVEDLLPQNNDELPQDFDNGIRGDPFMNDFDMQDVEPGIGVGDDYNDDRANQRRSSEEPGQARNVSRPPSILGGNFDVPAQLPASGSQRSSLFPWDNAGGGSSSAGGFGPMGSDRVSVDKADMRLRGSSLSHRHSSLVPSRSGSILDGLEMSPGFAKDIQLVGEDYKFDVDNQPNRSAVDSQRSDMNLITLERNSFNFLEYIRMQLQGLPNSVSELSFDAVVPTATSTRHVAAAAFYHCLVLATKDLLHMNQSEAYGVLEISIA
ncbi:RNA cytidine acetyltransferase [Favolaschia claudopus]|uniref:RNA cytidine acetyltransferase n=1 Tax=Favolaschia claudopus TaxID=2862362 RepID=A0AAW0EHM9_9AGAR